MHVNYANINPLDEIFLFNQPWMRKRFALSSGTQEVSEINDIPCVHRAFIPKEPWKPLSLLPLMSFGRKREDLVRRMGIGRLPLRIHLQFYRTGIHLAENLAEAQRIYNSPEFQAATSSLVGYLERRSGRIGSSEVHSIYVGEPGLTTTTFNKATGAFIGLHFDNFEAFQSENRKEARNRICLNLGQQSRFLYVLPIGFNSIKRLLDIKNSDYGLSTVDVIGRILELYPEYPVLRMEVGPFEYYVASTEYYIHDGSTIRSDKPDINLAIRGFFY
jgi:hypothetical protein